MSRHGSSDLGQVNQAFEADDNNETLVDLQTPASASSFPEKPEEVQLNDLAAPVVQKDAPIESDPESVPTVTAAAAAAGTSIPDKVIEDDEDEVNNAPEKDDLGKPSRAAASAGAAALDMPIPKDDDQAAGYSGGFGNNGFVPDSGAGDASAPKEPAPAYTPRAGDIVPVLQVNGVQKNPDKDGLAEKIADPEAPAPPERGQWSNQMEFLLSCIAMSVGLGNIWRFPFTAYENGGGAFLIPYLIVLLFVGRPIYFLELCLGQFSSLSQVKVWRLNPFFRGVGYGSMIATILVMSYYCSIMALTVFYFIMSFRTDLPWDKCNDKWEGNCTAEGIDGTSIAQLYYSREVLKLKSQIDDGIGYPDWRLTLCLLFSWLVIFGSLIKGVKSSGKVAYFTALFPYVVLLTLLIRGVTLDGAWTGIKYFIEPQWHRLKDPGVWYAAVSQCFYSLNTGFGSVIMFSSYNPFKHNIYRDAVILSFMDTFTSLLAGFTIFSVLGNLSHVTGIAIEDVMDGGNGLAFISYPTAIARFPWAPQLFAVLFFLMLFTLGIGSATADAGAIISIFADQFPTVKRWQITAGLCSSAFLFGLVYVTPGGQWILDLVDFFGASFVIFVTSTLEVIGVIWFYGLDNFIRDIEFMLNRRLGWYWRICWGFVIPVGLTGILIYYFVEDYKPITYGGVEYPTIAKVFGWIMAATALAALPVFAFIAVNKSAKSSFMEKLKDAIKPNDKWGPSDPKIRAEWMEFKRRNPLPPSLFSIIKTRVFRR